VSGDLQGARDALADALPENQPYNEALHVIFQMVGELSWQLVNLLEVIEEDWHDRADRQCPLCGQVLVHGPECQLPLAHAVHAYLNDALTNIAHNTEEDHDGA